MFSRKSGFARIEKVVGQFQKLIDEVKKGVDEIESTIIGNNNMVADAERSFNELKEIKSEQNLVLDGALKRGQNIADNINSLIGK